MGAGAGARTSRSGPARALALSVAGSVLARAGLVALRRRPPGGSRAWDRSNHRGATVSLLAGPALVAAASATSGLGAPTRRLAAAALGVGLAAGAVGRYDDTRGASAEEASDKGFHGHLRALAAGRLSGGAVKVVGIGVASVLAAGAITRQPAGRLVTGGVIAGTANLVNLLDVRPGRALKASILLGAPLLSGPYGGMLAGPLGAAAALLPDDLAERVMLGDAGANGLGALLGLRLAAGASPRGRVALLSGLGALTAASEVVSFSRVIAATPGLRELDALGRRPSR